ncbi:MAG TPA: universal stress protein [Chthoniobacterales bacterium]|jgi:manganese transport protein|nr:universal stress protein [Chthoniobacterales bacterium]HEV3391936.1 universal stress protein [Chthoniobacterales bacterium]
MYKKILVALENSRADQTLLPHVSELAKLHHSELLLVHVADGFVARNYNQLNLMESDEMKDDRAYLENAAANLRGAGLAVDTYLALGDPAHGILKAADERQCDLIAMTAHGHRLLGDLLFGSTINEVRHKAHVPVLLVRAGK